jgi:hypothetical protein
MLVRAWALLYLLIVEQGNGTLRDLEKRPEALFKMRFHQGGIPSIHYLILIHHFITISIYTTPLFHNNEGHCSSRRFLYPSNPPVTWRPFAPGLHSGKSSQLRTTATLQILEHLRQSSLLLHSAMTIYELVRIPHTEYERV